MKPKRQPAAFETGVTGYKDALSAKLAECFITIKGRRYNFMQMINFGIILFSMVVLFQLFTLPVEFNASNRALKWMDENRLMADMQHDRAKNALFWAAMTYVIAALGSIAQLMFYASFLMRRRR